MPLYRFDLFCDDGRLLKSIEHDCTRNMVAVEVVKALGKQGIKCELWSGNDLILATVARPPVARATQSHTFDPKLRSIGF